MFKNFVRIGLLMGMLLSTFTTTAMATPSSVENEAIEHLINFVRDSNLSFIRNRQRYDAARASGHIRTKYEAARSKILTAEDFIESAASKSTLTGRPYLVILPDGSQTEVKSWMTEELVRYRGSKEAQSH